MSTGNHEVSSTEGQGRVQYFRGDIMTDSAEAITIPVNIGGVMGAGLAEQMRVQWPNRARQYETLCNNRVLKIGEPVYLPAEPGDEEPGVLLFPTKTHWSKTSRLEYVEQGLDYLVANHRKEFGFGSLAIPALGCGYGKLDWRDVAPLVKVAALRLEIPVHVYLPNKEKEMEW